MAAILSSARNHGIEVYLHGSNRYPCPRNLVGGPTRANGLALFAGVRMQREDQGYLGLRLLRPLWSSERLPLHLHSRSGSCLLHQPLLHKLVQSHGTRVGDPRLPWIPLQEPRAHVLSRLRCL